MSIRTKLLFSYIAMIAVPVVLFGLAVVLAAGLYIRDMSDGLKNTGPRDGPIPFAAFKNLFEGRDELSSGLRFIAEHDPRLLGDPAFLSETEADLAKADAGIVVASGGSIAYASPGLAAKDILDRLEADNKDDRDTGFFNFDSHGGVDLEGIPYIGPEGSPGMLVIASDMEPVARFFKKFVPTVFLSLLLALVLTNGLLTYFVSRSIIKPLYALKDAAGRIREGNLDREIRLRRQDEIGQLGSAFEEMRIRLKDSIGAKVQMEENRKELLANISHDLKTPITAIQGCVDCLRDGIADTEEKRSKYVDMIGSKTSDMDRMIEELLLYSTLDIGKLPFHWEVLDLADYLQRTLEELRIDPRLTGVDITFDRPGKDNVALNHPILVRADREKLHRAILNIVDNSLKHMERDPRQLRFELSGDDDGTVVEVRISDNGVGIPEEALHYVFDRFFRAETSRHPNAGSSGLGLAIVKQIVDEHGGTVEALSIVGQGTSIRIRLPAIATLVDQRGESI
ncbi:sensor histidine kinase [Cohnella lupini]|uniref:histidine kinase n=1 Tax=Cohnella lupini TaxID=1294267 RepID=A0A3D9IBL7_9BACL|nr:HAMP domain-containing sensor histidine kinase [Cohnella lupini]RED58596.1 signal transduction histidine kinase [Cohnella lupini]